jgi:hypothetical protein
MDVKDEKHLHEDVVANDSTDGRPRRKGGVMNKLYPPGPTGGARPRMKNHCRKFWWCDCLILIIIVLVIVLPIIFVAIPKKAQHDLNKSELTVLEQDATEPRPDGIHLKLVTLAKSYSKFHPTIDGFEAALSLKDQEPFLHIDVPEVKANKETTILVDQDRDFASLERFSDYTKTVMGSEEFQVYMDGKTKLRLSGLKAMKVNYNKVITMKGLNHLKGLNITEIHILKKPLADGSNMNGTVFIPNPSVMTLHLGNVTMDLSVEGRSIGQTLLPDLILRPGDNFAPMLSNVNQGAVITLITSKYKNAILPLTIIGNSSKVGDKHLTYYEAAIRSNTVKLDLNVGPALKEMGLNLGGL